MTEHIRIVEAHLHRNGMPESRRIFQFQIFFFHLSMINTSTPTDCLRSHMQRYYVCFKKEKGVDLNIKKIDSDNIV